MGSVLFVVMPFCGVERPQIGVSTLKTALLQRGIPCEIAYLNIPYAESLGFETYSWITNNYSYEVFAGEWVFARELFADSEIHHQQYVDEVLIRYGAFDRKKLDRVSRMAELVPPFMDYCMRAVDWERYSLVGFTSTFEQNLPSLLLAKKLKEKYPNMLIAMGGGNCGGEMGLQLHKSFPFLDFVFTGEADQSFPELAQRLGRGDHNYYDMKGFVYRDGTISTLCRIRTTTTFSIIFDQASCRVNVPHVSRSRLLGDAGGARNNTARSVGSTGMKWPFERSRRSEPLMRSSISWRAMEPISSVPSTISSRCRISGPCCPS
jgi:hypothetical protein